MCDAAPSICAELPPPSSGGYDFEASPAVALAPFVVAPLSGDSLKRPERGAPAAAEPSPLAAVLPPGADDTTDDGTLLASVYNFALERSRAASTETKAGPNAAPLCCC